MPPPDLRTLYPRRNSFVQNNIKRICQRIYPPDIPPYKPLSDMYNEEYLPDDAVFENETNVSIDETSSMDTITRDRKNRHELYKRSDSDYYTFKTQTRNADGNLKRHKVEIYSSPATGFIRNASTGVREQYRVGSKYEDLFFRVKDTALYSGTVPRKLFYRNPEEYERHQGVKISSEIKSAWNDKYIKMNALYNY